MIFVDIGERFAHIGYFCTDLRRRVFVCGAEIGAKVSYVGKAFTYVYENHTDINLYQPDNTHPMYVGSYMSACVHAASMLGIDPRTSTFDGELDTETAALMKEIAYRIVFEA